MNVKLVSNENGHVTAVQINLKDWKIIERKVRAFDIADGIKQGLKEAELIEKGKIKAKTIEQLLDEL